MPYRKYSPVTIRCMDIFTVVSAKPRSRNMDLTNFSQTSGFHRRLNEVFVLLGCYAEYSDAYRRFGISYPSHLQGTPLKMRPIVCPKTSLNYYQYTSVTTQNSEHLISVAYFRRWSNWIGNIPLIMLQNEVVHSH